MSSTVKTAHVEGQVIILREPRPTRFFLLEPLIARVLGPGIMRLITKGIEIGDGDDKRTITAIDLLDAKEDPSIAIGVGTAAFGALVSSLGDAEPEDVLDLAMRLMEGCTIAGTEMPHDDRNAMVRALDTLRPVSGRGLTQIAALQIWHWFVPTLPARDTGAAT